MKLKDIYSKFQAFRWKSLLKGGDDDDDGIGVKGSRNLKKASWMMPISHGCHIIEDPSWRGEENDFVQPDNVVIQREEMGNLELWFYSVSDARVDGISRYMQANLFDRKVKEVCSVSMRTFKELLVDSWDRTITNPVRVAYQTPTELQLSLMTRKSKETMKKAYIDARVRIESDKPEQMGNVGSVSAMLISGEKIIMAQMGGYRAIVCRDGMAHQLRAAHQYRGNSHWPLRLISGAMRISKVHIQGCHFGSELSRKQTNNSELITASERIDSETEFIILASIGISEVMRDQEAVDLIRHIDDPQEAAECLTREALARMSRSNISCLVIRFD